MNIYEANYKLIHTGNYITLKNGMEFCVGKRAIVLQGQEQELDKYSMCFKTVDEAYDFALNLPKDYDF